jgi:hypothetical protein
MRIRIDFSGMEPDPDRQKWPVQTEKMKKCIVLEVLDVFF